MAPDTLGGDLHSKGLKYTLKRSLTQTPQIHSTYVYTNFGRIHSTCAQIYSVASFRMVDLCGHPLMMK